MESFCVDIYRSAGGIKSLLSMSNNDLDDCTLWSSNRVKNVSPLEHSLSSYVCLLQW